MPRRSIPCVLPWAALLLASACGSQPSPRHVHLSWQGPTTSTLTVTWRSDEPAGTVQYGADPGYGRTNEARTQELGDSYVHVATLTDLIPGTAYHYRCGSDGAWSDDFTFTTAPASGAPFRFVAWGDSRSDDEARRRVRAAVAARDPLFSIFVGDAVEDGRDQEQWDEWFDAMESLVRNRPFMPVIGNHERNDWRYYGQFALPTHPFAEGYDDEAYYSFDVAGVHFIGLSTEAPLEGAQRAWLESDLAQASNDPSVRWIIPFAHRPPYSSGEHGSSEGVRALWTPLFERYGVRLTFWGHDHDYERSKMLKAGSAVETGGVAYVVVGGSGAPLGKVGVSDSTAYSASAYHFVEVSVTDQALEVEARDVNGAVFDSVRILRDGTTERPAVALAPPSDWEPGLCGTSGPPLSALAVWALASFSIRRRRTTLVAR